MAKYIFSQQMFTLVWPKSSIFQNNLEVLQQRIRRITTIIITGTGVLKKHTKVHGRLQGWET